MACHRFSDKPLPKRVLTKLTVTKMPYGYAPVIRLKMAISGRHAHIHTGKTDISR